MLLQHFINGNYLLRKSSDKPIYVPRLGAIACLQVFFPAFRCFTGEPVDQVDADVAETVGTAQLYRTNGLSRIVAAFQQLERSVVKCLDAHADAVERQFGEHLQVFGQRSSGLASSVISWQFSIP